MTAADRGSRGALRRVGWAGAVGLVLVAALAAPDPAAGQLGDQRQSVTEGGAPAIGRPDAPLTVTVYADFLGPTCRRQVMVVQPVLLDRYVRPGKVRLLFRDLLGHGEPSLRASEAAACAGRQGRFWAMHALLFERQAEFRSIGPERLTDRAERWAREIEGLDQTAFGICLAERATRDPLRAADAEARRRGIVSPPVFEVGGRRLVGFQSVEALLLAIDAALR